MLARLRIGPKLLLAPGAVLVPLVLLSSGAYYAMVRQNESLDTIVGQRAVHMRAATELVVSSQRAHAQAYQALTWTGGSFSRARIEPLVADLRAQHAAIDRGFASLQQMTAHSPDERRSVEGARAAWGLYVAAVRDVLEIVPIDQSIGANAMSKAERAFAIVAQRLTELAQREQDLSEQASARAQADFRLMSMLMPLVVGLAVAASLAITVAVRRSLLAEVGAIEAVVRGLAGGDLTIRPRLDGQDEIAATSRALDASIRNLNGTLRTILESARSIGSASREIVLGRGSLPPRAGVRDSLERTAGAMRELAAAMHDNANSAHAATRLAENASLAAQHGGGTVHRLVATMEAVRRTALRLETIGAGIEAALGHASLAGSAPALNEARRAAREVGELARSAVGAIEDGTARALDAGSSMADLASSVQEVGDIVDRIGSASSERARDLLGVNQAIVRMDEMTRQGSRLVEEAALAARGLQQQALALSRAVATFRLDEAVQPVSEKETAPPGTPEDDGRPGRAGHPYLRLASSRGQGSAGDADYS
ncbi:methyl-accepting chemotaxis protein [Massilia sp. YIM B02763]|uniref:methyl-accepting chemotaxis protein n=1 Tax=Massilia sp. YIM B02763 TaxID=3050130 RepID=UPI0025B725E8|nr:methyl-accepting chemotaxis protein [Massilia sp. YIM B02763]MDN4051826.1 methyl-accepting chemotaxis protein [Massilia sp. YIM B02763]